MVLYDNIIIAATVFRTICICLIRAPFTLGTFIITIRVYLQSDEQTVTI